LFSVSTRTIEKWTKDIRDKEKEEVKQRIFDLWLSCWSQEEIAEELGVTQQTVFNTISTKMRNFSEICIEPPSSLRIYDVWNFSKCDERFIKTCHILLFCERTVRRGLYWSHNRL
jgi:DNA-binding XRE family transcriptional regulator